MRTWAIVSGVLSAAVIAASGTARADTASDRAAAIVVFPRIEATRLELPFPDEPQRLIIDTVIQLSNTSNQPVQVKCFYINANSHCSTAGNSCAGTISRSSSGQRCGLNDEVCQPGWSETDFHLTLTAQQPLAWLASEGLGTNDVPLDGTLRQGPGGQSNAGTRVPPVVMENAIPAAVPVLVGTVAEEFTGELKCIAVDEQGRAIPSNVLKGEATTVTLSDLASQADSLETIFPSVDKYSAIGIQAIGGDANGDRVLELGGDAGEYNGCPNVLVMDHFFDNDLAVLLPFPAVAGAEMGRLPGAHEVSAAQVFLPTLSTLTLVPCSQDLAAQIPGKVVTQFLVFNEFEQRFSTSATVDCFFESLLSNIDTPQGFRSIFNTAVAGTISGQTRIRGVGGGLLGILRQGFEGFGSAAFNLHIQGERAQADRIIIPEP